MRRVAKGIEKEGVLQYILISAVNQEDIHKFCNILVDKEEKCGKKYTFGFNPLNRYCYYFFYNSLRHQMGFILFDKLHFHLLY